MYLCHIQSSHHLFRCAWISIRILTLLIIFSTCSSRSIWLRNYTIPIIQLLFILGSVSNSVVRWIHCLALSSMLGSLNWCSIFIVASLFLYFINSSEFDSLSMCKCFFFHWLGTGAFVHALWLTRLLSMNLNIVGSHRKQCQCAFATGRIWLMNVVVICVNSSVARSLLCVWVFFWVRCMEYRTNMSVVDKKLKNVSSYMLFDRDVEFTVLYTHSEIYFAYVFLILAWLLHSKE